MKLIGFSIAEDFIALERGPDRFDLHTNFDFQGLSYNPAKQTLELLWRRGLGEWVKPTEPSDLCMSFAGVYLFKVQERDAALPFTEDACLDSVGFMWDDLVTEMRAFTSNHPGDGCTHLTANFMSGFSIKVGAESAVLLVAGGAQQFVQADPASWRRPRAYATLARVRHPAAGRLNSGVRPHD